MEEAQTSQREKAKDGRRTRIIDAAHDLLRESGIDDVSVKTIATRAEVSPATVYNLFGTKQAVLAGVFDRDLEQYLERVTNARSADALERIFDALAIASTVYRAEPDFYRVIFRARSGETAEPALDAALHEPRNRFWHWLVEEALSGRHLKPETNTAMLASLLIRLYRGGLADWVAGGVDVERFEAEMRLGFAAILLPYATAEAAARLSDKLGEAERAWRVG